jgi:biotin-(acetyl-CoA carboxylase) ligase
VNNSEQLAARLAQLTAPHAAVVYEPSVGSTSTSLKELARLGRLNGPTLMYTHWQSEGRGTRGRTWTQPQPGVSTAPARDVALTLALPAGAPQLADPRLSLAVGAIAAEAVERAYPQDRSPWTFVKWPNDLLAGAPGGAGRELRKFGGILLESSGGWVFVGLGINVNSLAADYPAELRGRLTTLREVLAQPGSESKPASAAAAPDPPELEIAVLFESLATQLIRGLIIEPDIGQGVRHWLARNRTAGARYVLRRGGFEISVTASHVIELSGELVCCDAEGRQYAVRSYRELEPAETGTP